jgi:hypothetical protein
MKLRLHTCRAEGCQRQVSVRLLMCIDHWRMVPAPLKRDVTEALKAMRRDSTLAPDYWGEVARAVAAVKEKQERKAQAAAGPSGSLFNEA